MLEKKSNIGYTIWLIGLSSSGKTSLANEIYKYLIQRNIKTQILDGDIFRNFIGNIFGYSREDRINVSKIYTLCANLLNNNGISVIVSAITAFQEMRDFNLDKIDNYIEIYLDCCLDVCQKRDIKGIYHRFQMGEEKYVVGMDLKFEKPQNSNLVVDTSDTSIKACMAEIKKYLHTKIVV